MDIIGDSFLAMKFIVLLSLAAAFASVSRWRCEAYISHNDQTTLSPLLCDVPDICGAALSFSLRIALNSAAAIAAITTTGCQCADYLALPMPISWRGAVAALRA